MTRRFIPLCALLLALAGCDGAAPEAPDAARLTTLRSDSITLPDDPETFAAAGADPILDRNCLACHSVAMVRYQPRLKPAQWEATVEKMRAVYGAPIAPDDAPRIAAALEALQASQGRAQ